MVLFFLPGRKKNETKKEGKIGVVFEQKRAVFVQEKNPKKSTTSRRNVLDLAITIATIVMKKMGHTFGLTLVSLVVRREDDSFMMTTFSDRHLKQIFFFFSQNVSSKM